MSKSKAALKIKYPLSNKLLSIVVLAVVPFLIITIYLIFSLLNYSKAYEEIVGNMTVANNYNVYFKENMDESIYKLVVGYVDFNTIDDDVTLQNPYIMINQLREDFNDLMADTDGESRSWLKSLLRNVDSLEGKIKIIEDNLSTGGKYDENLAILDSDIYILTDLVQYDIQYFIYYQTKDIETLQKQLHLKVNQFIMFWAVIAGINVVLVIAMAVFMVRNMTRPLSELVEVTEKIADGDFESRASINTNDEIMTLADSVNDMSEHLEIMVNTIKEDEAKMRHAELRLLQEQINPHFLYNTLDTIVWLVESNDNDKAIDVVMSLSKFFRLVLSKGQETITIKDEEQHILSYLKIQQVRYHDILEYEINIDPDIYDYEIQKMTLQPLVENSLYHGIKYKRAKGIIKVTGIKEGENIVLSVSDDGVGMDEETLNNLREEISHKCKDTKSGFGLANVNERIRMKFGPEYGMTINSKEGEGTTISITIPAIIKEKTEDNNEEHK